MHKQTTELIQYDENGAILPPGFSPLPDGLRTDAQAVLDNRNMVIVAEEPESAARERLLKWAHHSKRADKTAKRLRKVRREANNAVE
jgi:hypothetical protein